MFIFCTAQVRTIRSLASQLRLNLLWNLTGRSKLKYYPMFQIPTSLRLLRIADVPADVFVGWDIFIFRKRKKWKANCVQNGIGFTPLIFVQFRGNVWFRRDVVSYAETKILSDLNFLHQWIFSITTFPNIFTHIKMLSDFVKCGESVRFHCSVHLMDRLLDRHSSTASENHVRSLQFDGAHLPGNILIKFEVYSLTEIVKKINEKFAMMGKRRNWGLLMGTDQTLLAACDTFSHIK